MDKCYKVEKKVISYMEKHCMIEAGDQIVIGVSGGADSVCLFFLLLEYRKKIPFTIQVVHVNHGIRPDAGKDAEYVEKLCSERQIPFVLVEENVRAYAEREKCSEEDAGRRIRYAAFERQAGQLGNAKIAVAHNASDCAETMLLHLFRGSGPRGLCGIEPVRGNVIRPILCLQREEIEEYLAERCISWCTDSTNLEDGYTRNRVRHHILPYVEKEISSNCIKRMCKTAELMTETERFMKDRTLEAKARCVSAKGIDVDAFLELPGVLQKRILLDVMEEMSLTGKDIGLVHVEDVLTLVEKQGNRTICLPFGIRFRRQYQLVIPEKEGWNRTESLPEPVFRVFPYERKMEIPENQYTKWFDYDKITMYVAGETPKLRYRSTGDYLTLADGKGGIIHKSLKDYMVTEKIPKEMRSHIPVLADGSHILWLVGFRISEYYKVSGNTKKILEVRILR